MPTPRPGRSSSSTSRSGGPARPSTAPTRTGPRTGPRPGQGRAGGGAGSGRSASGAPRGARPAPSRSRPPTAARAKVAAPVAPPPSQAWVRGAILIGIVVMLAVTLVPTIRSLVQQQHGTSETRASIAQQRETVAALERQAALWKDPSYVEVQARERLKFVRVGDRAYSVIDPSQTDRPDDAAAAPVVSAPMANDAAPWYGKVWQSIQIADRPTAGLPQKK
jgi:cell division protein FtsB